jgi:hypothetical protein
MGGLLVRRFCDPHAARRERELVCAVDELRAYRRPIRLHEAGLGRRRRLLAIDRRNACPCVMLDPPQVLRDIGTLADQHGLRPTIAEHGDGPLPERVQHAVLVARS